MAEYNILYMQRHEFVTGLPVVQPWKENDDDIEYMLATPKRKAADAMYEACKYMLDHIERFGLAHPDAGSEWWPVLDGPIAAIALADGDKGE